MARYDAAVEAIEPTGIRVVPRTVLDHSMVMDAVTRGFLERPVRNLIHAHRARRWLVQRQGIPRQMPPPVGPRHRIPSSFNLRQRSQQLGCHDRCRMFTEERAVLLPRLGWVLVERVVQRKEDFGGLIEYMIRPIDAEPEQQDTRYDHDSTYGRRRGEHGFLRSTEHTPTRARETPEGFDGKRARASLAAARMVGGAAIGSRGHGDTITEKKEGVAWLFPFAHGTPTMKRWSFDVRSWETIQATPLGRKQASSEGASYVGRAQWKINQPPSLRDNERAWREHVYRSMRAVEDRSGRAGNRNIDAIYVAVVKKRLTQR
jgi:hypothetical protein